MTPEENLRDVALQGRCWSFAHDNVGIYPQSIKAEVGGYEKRTERMEGWNECAVKHSHYYMLFRKWLSELPQGELGRIIEDLILEGTIDLRGEEKDVKLLVNCNDVFLWGCADAEEVTIEELPALLTAIKEAREAGAESSGELLWIARKRQERPQGAFYAYVPPALGKLFDTCGPYRESGPGNPIGSSFEEGEKYREELRARTD